MAVEHLDNFEPAPLEPCQAAVMGCALIKSKGQVGEHSVRAILMQSSSYLASHFMVRLKVGAEGKKLASGEKVRPGRHPILKRSRIS